MSDNWLQQETYKTLLTYGNNVTRAPVLLNGGAILALLTFLGNLIGNGGDASVEEDRGSHLEEDRGSHLD